MSADRIGYFGYGSLVNRATLGPEHLAAYPARLAGWRRHWQSRGADIPPGLALLSAHPDPTSSIEGMLIVDRISSLPALDQREMRYRRVPVRLGDLELDFGEAPPPDLPDDLFVYVGLKQPVSPRDPPLLQSYLDVVMAGFLAEYGESGVIRFLESTDGFARSIVTDRAQPIYSRAVRVAPETARWFDGLLRAAGVRYDGATQD